MKTTVEQLEPTRVKLTVEVEPKRVAQALDAAARELSRGVSIPGFRRGKVPRKILESKIGKGAVVQQAVEDAVSAYYAEAIRDEELRVVAPPEIDLQHFDEAEGCAFEATVDVRPEFELPDHAGINVTFPEWEVGNDEVNGRIDDLRERFAELEEVDRPVRFGDYVTLDLEVKKGGEPIEDATVTDALYEVGTKGVTPLLDDTLAGAVAGQTLTYVDDLAEDYPEHGGERAEFTVTVKDVREKHLPDLDDDFALTASEFETMEELESDIRRGLRRRKLVEARQDLRARILEAYLATVDVPLPEAMVEHEKSRRVADLERQAEQYGMALDSLFEMQGADRQTYLEQLDEQIRRAVKAQLVLEALAEGEGIEVASADLEREIRRHAARQGVDASAVARVINEQGSVGVLVGDVVRRKALDLLVEAAEVDGAPSDETLAELGLGPTGEGATLGEPAADPGAATEPQAPDLGGEGEPAAAAAEETGSAADESGEDLDDAGDEEPAGS
ncbi:MAG: trigger factor [Nitriliruptorales bacterium]